MATNCDKLLAANVGHVKRVSTAARPVQLVVHPVLEQENTRTKLVSPLASLALVYPVVSHDFQDPDPVMHINVVRMTTKTGIKDVGTQGIQHPLVVLRLTTAATLRQVQRVTVQEVNMASIQNTPFGQEVNGLVHIISVRLQVNNGVFTNSYVSQEHGACHITF